MNVLFAHKHSLPQAGEGSKPQDGVNLSERVQDGKFRIDILL